MLVAVFLVAIWLAVAVAAVLVLEAGHSAAAASSAFLLPLGPIDVLAGGSGQAQRLLQPEGET